MKKLTAFAILAALSISLVSVQAQDGGRRGRRGHFRGGPQQSQQTSAETLEQWAAVQAQLKKEFPKQYAEIETLQKTNIFAAFEKLRALAKTADIQTPAQFSGRGPEGGWRPGREHGGREGFGGGRGDWRGRNRGNSRNAVEAKLKTDFAAEYAEVTKLRIEALNKLEALARKAKVTLPEDWNSYQLKLEAIRLSGKYKTEFEKIDALMKKGEIRAALAETSQIAKKEGMEPPAFGPRGGRDGRGGPEGGPGEPARGGRDNPLQKLREVRKKYPEEVKKLEAIRRDDPRAYRDGIRKLIERYDAEQKKP